MFCQAEKFCHQQTYIKRNVILSAQILVYNIILQ